MCGLEEAIAFMSEITVDRNLIIRYIFGVILNGFYLLLENIVAKFAEIEKIRKAYSMSVDGLCAILCVSQRTYYEWGINDIPGNSKCHAFLNLFVTDHAEIIKNHVGVKLGPSIG